MDPSVSMRELEECLGEEWLGQENPQAQAELKPPALKLANIFKQNRFQLNAQSSIYKT